MQPGKNGLKRHFLLHIFGINDNFLALDAKHVLSHLDKTFDLSSPISWPSISLLFFLFLLGNREHKQYVYSTSVTGECPLVWFKKQGKR